MVDINASVQTACKIADCFASWHGTNHAEGVDTEESDIGNNTVRTEQHLIVIDFF